jgi:hypothetical protein
MLKWKNVIIGTIVLITSAGCGNAEKSKGTVSIIGGGKFPAALAGTWKSTNKLWSITFNKDGSLKGIKYYFNSAPMNLSEGGGYDRDNVGEVRAVYVFGPYSTVYDPNSRQLTLEIKIDHFEADRPLGKFNGWMQDTFTGKVSEDEKTWNAKWTNTTKFEQFPKPSNKKEDLVFTKQE